MAAPWVSGTVALMMAAAKRPLTIHEIRSALIGAADPHPGPAGMTSTQLGYGYLNPAAAVAAARLLGSTPPGARPRAGEDEAQAEDRGWAPVWVEDAAAGAVVDDEEESLEFADELQRPELPSPELQPVPEAEDDRALASDDEASDKDEEASDEDEPIALEYQEREDVEAGDESSEDEPTGSEVYELDEEDDEDDEGVQLGPVVTPGFRR
jgi:hypothetical protein